ncbi:transcription repressor OFP8-like [Quillaja saponaria]|uniref:Transcription repressor n=1 Tax=Quillaja saponaria TaxID=32244 RepID=A0AAD7PW78_QUISA|nr:transcription repressor OFP8-like [Quillaja saponaria]
MDTRIKMKISRMFRSSFGACRIRNLSDVMEKAVFIPQNHRGFDQIEPLYPKARPFPSICKPKWSETYETIDDSCVVQVKDSYPRRKVSERACPFVSTNLDGRSCPPASPISPWNPFNHSKEFGFDEKIQNSAKKRINKKNKNKKKKKTHVRNRSREIFPFSNSSQDTNFGGYWWYSSDDDDEADDETETLFSSKTLSSDSSASRRRHHSRRRKHGSNRIRSKKESSEMGVLPLHGKVKDSFAVVKRSSDPYNDFRTSMLEMIVEKQIFGANDLENLLQCFLSLNSHHHHRIIVEVFTEIWEALFSNWS